MLSVVWRTSDTYLAVTVVVLLALSGFFAMAETSLVRMNKSRARSLHNRFSYSIINWQFRYGDLSLHNLYSRYLHNLVICSRRLQLQRCHILDRHLLGGRGSSDDSNDINANFTTFR